MLFKVQKLAASVLVLCAGAAMAQPGNDLCSNPEPISGLGDFAFDSFGAVTDGVEFGCALGQAYNDVWYCWTATESGPVRAKLCNGSPGFDTVIAVYDGCGCPADFGEIVCNDDSCGLSSSVNFDAVAGQTYLIRIGAFDEGGTGAGTLTLETFIPGVVLGPIVSPINGNTYYLLEPNSWTGGEEAANALGGHLATVRSAEENDWIYSEVIRAGGAIRRGWIGLNDVAEEGTFVWSSGEPVTYTNWGAGEPNNANGVENFAQIPWFSLQWNDNSDLPGDDPCYPVVEIVNGNSCPADFNGDDFVDFFDYADFVACFEGECLAGQTADFNGDDFVDFFDYSDFVDAFETGC